MSIRETLERHQVAVGVAVVAAVAVGLVAAFRGSSTSTDVAVGGRAYYSSDEGKTFFADAAGRATPFAHGGHDAVRAIVVRCKGADPKVAYLMRLSEAGRNQLDRLDKALAEADRVMTVERAGSEVRSPTQPAWHPVESAAAAAIMSSATKCPDGSDAEYVTP